MNREESNILRGAASLIVLAGHCATLFANRVDNITYILIKSISFGLPIFLFISGYGLYFASISSNKPQWKRLIPLMINFWIVLFISMVIGSFIVPERSLDSFGEIIWHISTFKYYYNPEWWFLHNYIVLALLFPLILKFVNRVKLLYIIPILTIIHIAAYTASYLYFRNGIIVDYITTPLSILTSSYPFMLGIIVAKYSLIKRFRIFIHTYIHTYIHTQYILFSLLVIVLLLRYFSPVSFIRPFCAIVFIFIFSSMSRPKFLDTFLLFISVHSVNIWLTHTFFTHYFFGEIARSIESPLFIVLSTLVFSLIMSMMIIRIHNPLSSYVVSKIDKY